MFTIAKLRVLGSLNGLGDDFSSYEGGGDGSSYFNSENPSSVYGGDTNYVAPPSYDQPGQSTSDTSANSYSESLQAQALDTGYTISSDVVATAPSSPAPSSIQSWIEPPSSSIFDNIFGPPNQANANTGGGSIVTPPSSTSFKVAPTKPTARKGGKAAMPAKSTSKPSKVNNQPNISAYEALFAANLAAFLASSETDSDKAMGENYFTQEWGVFAGDMNGAGSWGVQGLKDRNRGGKFDWWAKYYDPIANAQSTGSGSSLENGVSSLLGSSSSLESILIFGVALFLVWKLTE